MIGLALAGELFEAWIGFRYAQRYGGSGAPAGARSSAGWSAQPSACRCRSSDRSSAASSARSPGRAAFEYTRSAVGHTAARAGWGAMLGRATAAAVKIALGVVLVVGSLILALRG